MDPARRDPLDAPENPTPPRDRQEAERRIAQADQAITRLRAEIAAYRYKYEQRDRYCGARRKAIFCWEREKGICRDFLKAQPAAHPAGPPARGPVAPAPAAVPPAPVVLPLPALTDLQRIEAFLDDGIRAAANEKRRRLSTPVEVAVEHLAIIRRYTLSITGGNVLPLRQRSG